MGYPYSYFQKCGHRKKVTTVTGSHPYKSISLKLTVRHWKYIRGKGDSYWKPSFLRAYISASHHPTCYTRFPHGTPQLYTLSRQRSPTESTCHLGYFLRCLVTSYHLESIVYFCSHHQTTRAINYSSKIPRMRPCNMYTYWAYDICIFSRILCDMCSLTFAVLYTPTKNPIPLS